MLETVDFYNLFLLFFIASTLGSIIGNWLYKSISINKPIIIPNDGGNSGELDKIYNALHSLRMTNAKTKKQTKKQSTPAPSGGGMMDMVGGLLNNPEVMKMVGSMLSPPPQAPPPKPKK